MQLYSYKDVILDAETDVFLLERDLAYEELKEAAECESVGWRKNTISYEEALEREIEYQQLIGSTQISGFRSRALNEVPSILGKRTALSQVIQEQSSTGIHGTCFPLGKRGNLETRSQDVPCQQLPSLQAPSPLVLQSQIGNLRPQLIYNGQSSILGPNSGRFALQQVQDQRCVPQLLHTHPSQSRPRSSNPTHQLAKKHGVANALWCKECRVPCTNENALAQHLAGKKHAARLLILQSRDNTAAFASKHS